MSTGIGTPSDPIVAMSADPAQIAKDIRASLAHFTRTDDPYWLEKESTPAQFSNGLWHLGHNRYWETAMQPDDTGSRNPADGRLPARYGATVTVPVPPIVLPDPPSAPPDATAAGVLALVLARLDAIDARLTRLESRPTPTLPSFPNYTTTVHAPWPIGTQTITLTPVPEKG